MGEGRGEGGGRQHEMGTDGSLLERSSHNKVWRSHNMTREGRGLLCIQFVIPPLVSAVVHIYCRTVSLRIHQGRIQDFGKGGPHNC